MEHIFPCNLTHTGQKVTADTFPHGIGYIATYLEKIVLRNAQGSQPHSPQRNVSQDHRYKRMVTPWQAP